MTKICACGDCASAFERAGGIVSKMLKDNECGSYAMAVSEAMSMLCVAVMQGHAQRVLQMDQLSAGVAALQTDAKFQQQLSDFALGAGAKLTSEIVRDLNSEGKAFEDRLRADYDATKSDSPDIKKGG